MDKIIKREFEQLSDLEKHLHNGQHILTQYKAGIEELEAGKNNFFAISAVKEAAKKQAAYVAWLEKCVKKGATTMQQAWDLEIKMQEED